MTTLTYPSYEAAAQEYLARFQALRALPPLPAAETVTRRGAAELPTAALIAQAGAIADVSSSMLPLARPILESPDPLRREGLSGQLLAQATAELHVANELLTIAAAGAPTEAGSPTAPAAPDEAAETTRAARGAGLFKAIHDLEQAMAAPIAAGLAPEIVRRGAKPSRRDEAKDGLKLAATVSAAAITQRVAETGGSLAFDLVFNTQWAAVVQSAGLLNQDIARLLEKAKLGVTQAAQAALSVAARTLANAYDKLLALLGKDLQDQARKKIQEWLKDIKKEGKIALFDQLVARLYKVDQLEKDLPTWLDKTKVGLEQLNATSGEVTALSEKFTALVGRISLVENVIGLAKYFEASLPQLLVIATALRVVLLAVLVYSGQDYIDYSRRGKFLNFTPGVAEVLRKNLGV